jgi:hypothetical protein
MGGELPLLPFGIPIGLVPASRGGVYIKSIDLGEVLISLLSPLSPSLQTCCFYDCFLIPGGCPVSFGQQA